MKKCSNTLIPSARKNHISSCSSHFTGVDSVLLFPSAIATSFSGVAEAAPPPGTPKTGAACLIRTGGATQAGRAKRAVGGGSGGAEKTGTAVLIVTGGAIPW